MFVKIKIYLKYKFNWINAQILLILEKKVISTEKEFINMTMKPLLFYTR